MFTAARTGVTLAMHAQTHFSLRDQPDAMKHQLRLSFHVELVMHLAMLP